MARGRIVQIAQDQGRTGKPRWKENTYRSAGFPQDNLSGRAKFGTEQKTHQKRTYQINRTQAYRKTRPIINQMFSNMNDILQTLEKYAIQLIAQAEIVRPNRIVNAE